MNSIIINVCVRNKHKYLLSVHIGRVCGCFLSSPRTFRLLELELFNSYLLLCNIARCCMVWQNFFIDAEDWIWNMFDDDVSSGWLEDVDLMCAYVICLFGFSNIRPNKFDEIISYRTRWLVMRMNWFLSRRVDIGLPYFPIAKSMERPRVVAKWFGCMKYCENINDIQFIVRLKFVITHASGAKTPENVNDVLLRRQNRRK